MKVNSLLLLLTVISFPARALTVTCVTPESIEEDGAMDCQDNGKFGEAAIACMKDLERAIAERTKRAQLELAASNAAHSAMGNAQNHNFAGSEADYAISQASLSDLIAASKHIRKRVDSYLDHVYYPTDWDAPEELIGDVNEYIEGEPCYAENAEGIKGIVKRIDGYIEQFEQAKVASAKRGTTSSGREGLQNSIGHGAVTGGKSTPGAPGKMQRVPSGKSNNGRSDITGVKEDKQKQLQKR
jgi:hypothetical protein